MQKQNVEPTRLRSLDALRGFDMLFIMGGASLIVALNVLFPNHVFDFLADQMHHVKWDGLKHHDTIFPLFLFIAGISFPFSLDKQRGSGRTQKQIITKIIRRGLTLVLLGIVYNGLLNWDFSNLRCASVLGRIGLAWMFAALLYMYFKTKTRAFIAGGILIGYWLLLAFVPAPDGNGAAPFSMEGCLVGYVDRLLLPGKLYYDNLHDPEGLLSAVPAIVTAMLGMFTGELVKLKKNGLSETKKVGYMVAAGISLLVIGLLWNCVFPINKNLWSSSFVCVVGAYSVLMFALFYYIIDIKGYSRWTPFFTVIGMNSITIYLAQTFINFSYTSDKVFSGTVALLPECARPLGEAVAYIAVCWLFLYFLYKQRIFLKV
jgi:predicted acyltransferase